MSALGHRCNYLTKGQKCGKYVHVIVSIWTHMTRARSSGFLCGSALFAASTRCRRWGIWTKVNRTGLEKFNGLQTPILIPRLVLYIVVHGPLVRYVKLRVAHAPGMPGTFSPPPWISDPDMHNGTCVTHVPWCMPGSLTSGFLWSRRWGKTFPAFPAHTQPAYLRNW